ncbi:hypothetical protein DDB_G0291894 [Dictyostelium discoideum AX4]|uniref:Condensin-2 complex subunit H2 n=1 Tax=Dictyostelium discoideum TaxID=44689 RepID=Q54DZ9_DICDI|nr:hypothetical protein DDB_G0291894 [Dictyostelium discoideum AX4]EAL61477.1 hypothetical protein DDB_G0291894 [Dictyostelium discoideum AX4]|eukprot:XP_629897.1 hypothetical protein DDB_G0291894 [Dictyostelium discoideum AX4]
MEVTATKDYSYLIQPIRDLAENWQIDISKELEDYLSDLDKISFTFEGTNQVKTLNFAEAALLIQGSAVIYSKKVEYLYSLLYQTLDLLAQKKKRKDATSINSEGVDRDIENEDDVEFLALDDILIEDDNIDLNDGENEEEDGGGDGGIRKKMKSNKRKENEDDQVSNESTYKIALMNNSSSTDRNLMMDLNGDSGTNEMDEKDIHSIQSNSNEIYGKKNDLKRSDFRMNDAIVSKNGAMVLRGLDFLDNENFLSNNKPLNFHRNQYTDDVDDNNNNNYQMNGGGGGGGDFFKKLNEKSNDSLLPPNGEHPLQPSSSNTNLNENNKDDGSGFENAGAGQDSSDDDNNDDDDDDDNNDGIGMKHDDNNDGTNPPPLPPTLQENGNNNNNLSSSSSKLNDKKDRLNRKKAQVQPTTKDAWALLNPFDEDVKNNSRPFKKGKTFNIPFNLLDSDKKKKLKKEKPTIESNKVEKVLSFSTEPIISFPNESLSLRGCFFKELNYLYNKNIQQNKQLLRKQRLANKNNGFDLNDEYDSNNNNNEEQFFTQENNNNEDNNGDGIGMGWGDDDDDDYGDLGGGGGDDSDYEGGDNNNNNNNNNIEYHDGPFQNGGSQYNFGNSNGEEHVVERFISENGIDIELSKPTQTYEELCRSYVEKYLESASKYVRETALSQRVNDWNNRLTPILIEQDSHPTFDIHVYGNKFLNGMKPFATTNKKLKEEIIKPTIETEEDEEEDDDDCIIINKEATVPFGEITKNSPTYEVCRMFTSCLQLANNGNIEIISNNKQIDTLNFHLLSLNEKHDIQGMQVPSKFSKNILDDDNDDDNDNNGNIKEKDNLSNKNDKKSNVKLKKPTKKKSTTTTTTTTKRNAKRQKKDESEPEEESEEESEPESEESESELEEISSDDEKIKKKQKTTSKPKPKPKPKSK